MSSIIKVGKVQSSTGQDAVTVADSGAITANGTLTTTGAITASGGIANAGTISAGTFNGTIGNSATRPNAIGIYGILGTTFTASGSTQANFNFSNTYKFINGVTESSGEITITTAGKYLGIFNGQTQTTADNAYFEGAIEMKPSGGSYAQYGNTGAIGYQWGSSSRSNWGCQAIMQCSANAIIRLRFYSAGSGGSCYAGASTTFSVFLIES